MSSPISANLMDGWRPRLRQIWEQTRAAGRLLGPSARLLISIENHTYAYSVAASVILAFLPFILLLITVADALHAYPAIQVIYELVRQYLPAGQGQIIHDLSYLAHHHTHSAAAFSLLMLAISSTGVFLPLEVALNGIWGFKKNRSYLANQAVSLGLVAACGVLAYLSVIFATWGQEIIHAVIFTLAPAAWSGFAADFYAVLSWIILRAMVIPASIAGFFLIYWLLPHGPVPAVQVFPAAFYTGLLAEIFQVIFRLLLPALAFQAVYASFALPVTLIFWGFASALLLLFGASLSARNIARMPAPLQLKFQGFPRFPFRRE